MLPHFNVLGEDHMVHMPNQIRAARRGHATNGQRFLDNRPMELAGPAAVDHYFWIAEDGAICWFIAEAEHSS